MPHENVMETFREGKVKHLVHGIADVCLKLSKEFRRVVKAFVDCDEDMNKKSDYLELAIVETPEVLRLGVFE